MRRARALIVRTACLLGLLFTLVGAAGSPTSTTPGQPSFEAAAIRLESPHSLEELTRGIGVFSMCKYPTSHYFAHFVSLQILAGMAYGFDSLHILGAEWLNTQLYSVDARVEGDAQLSQQEMKPLLRGLLEDRFHLKAHEETRTEAGVRTDCREEWPEIDAQSRRNPDVGTDPVRPRSGPWVDFRFLRPCIGHANRQASGK